MSDSKLESFKVADKHRPRVKTAQKPESRKASAASEPNPTLGFARIEAVLDQENPSHVQKELSQLLTGLESLTQKADSQKDRGQAKRAKAAVERTIDLLTYLFETKEGMLQAAINAPSDDARGARGRAARKGDK